MQYLSFGIGDLRCALPLDAVREVARAVAIRPLPGAPRFVSGAIDVHGTPIPVLDLHARFGLPVRPIALSDRLLIVQTRARTVALWVDAVNVLFEGEPQAFESPEGLLVGDRSLAGIAPTSNGLVLIHDVDGFISEAEAEALREVLAS